MNMSGNWFPRYKVYHHCQLHLQFQACGCAHVDSLQQRQKLKHARRMGQMLAYLEGHKSGCLQSATFDLLTTKCAIITSIIKHATIQITR